MKKVITIVFVFFAIQNTGFAQRYDLEKIHQELAIAAQDTNRVKLYNDLCNEYKLRRPDSAIYYGNKAVILANKINYPFGKVNAMILIILAHTAIGNDAKALEINLQATKIAEKNNMILETASLYDLLGRTYQQTHEYKKAFSLYSQSLEIFDSLHSYHFSGMVRTDLGELYILTGKLDSAQFYAQQAYDMAVQHRNKKIQYYSLPTLGKIQHLKGNDNLALTYYLRGLKLNVINYLYLNPNMAIARIYQQLGKQDSALFYARQSLDVALENGFYSSIIDASNFISKYYEETEPSTAIKYYKVSATYKDSLYNLGKSTAFENFTDFDEQERQFKLEKARTEYKNQLRINAFLGSISTLIIIAIFLFILFRRKQKAKQKIESAYDQLKSTQSQLIQSEKMASLGELTAGIAHEIQNPLNFVNNFSDLNKELLEELLEEADNGNIEDVKAIASDVIGNEEKISHHGKRAESIVKGMLLHSRGSSGQKEPTDINALCDEYLRLSYHGFRAKDKSFNADFKTEFDESLPKINIIPQDIGRVLLNLINNAFYVVNEKAKQQIEGYRPEVIVRTKFLPPSGGLRGASISVIDNGNGIPSSIVEKIFQPFFTTKPTGSGTGLGLSLSYDIVKAHGGELKVESAENQGTEFIIEIPITT